MNKTKLIFQTFTEGDWDAFAGAEPFQDGTDPLIAQAPESDAVVIVSGQGMQIVFGDENVATLPGRTLHRDFLIAIANLLPPRFTLNYLCEMGWTVLG